MTQVCALCEAFHLFPRSLFHGEAQKLTHTLDFNIVFVFLTNQWQLKKKIPERGIQHDKSLCFLYDPSFFPRSLFYGKTKTLMAPLNFDIFCFTHQAMLIWLYNLKIGYKTWFKSGLFERPVIYFRAVQFRGN